MSRAVSSPGRRRLDYVNHARRLAEDDWAGAESEGEEKEGEDEEEEEMDVDTGKKLPKRYANQVRSCPPPHRAGQGEGCGVVGAGLGWVWWAALVVASLRLRIMPPTRLGAQGGTVPRSRPCDMLCSKGGQAEVGCPFALGDFSAASSICMLLCSSWLKTSISPHV